MAEVSRASRRRVPAPPRAGRRSRSRIAARRIAARGIAALGCGALAVGLVILGTELLGTESGNRAGELRSGTHGERYSAFPNSTSPSSTSTGTLGLWQQLLQREVLHAGGEENGSALLDSDGDLLPDAAEWALLGDPNSTDTDGDGADDFIEAIEFQSLANGRKSGLAPVDGFRLVLNTSSSDGPTGRSFWIHLLHRFPSGQPQDLRALLLLFKTGFGHDLDLTPLLATPLVRELKTRFDPQHGLLQRISIELPEAPGFSTLAPCSFRAYSLVNQQILGSGMPLLFIGGSYHVLAHLSTSSTPQATNSPSAVLQVSGQGEMSNPFWARQKACVLKVETQAYGSLGILCEITSADCVTAQTHSCTASCKDSIGLLFTFPDALTLIMGG